MRRGSRRHSQKRVRSADCDAGPDKDPPGKPSPGGDVKVAWRSGCRAISYRGPDLRPDTRIVCARLQQPHLLQFENGGLSHRGADATRGNLRPLLLAYLAAAQMRRAAEPQIFVDMAGRPVAQRNRAAGDRNSNGPAGAALSSAGLRRSPVTTIIPAPSIARSLVQPRYFNRPSARQ
jgi:hypothetical protein